MKILSAVVRALPTTLAVYLIYAAVSLGQSLALGLVLDAGVELVPHSWTVRAATLDALHDALPLLRAKGLDIALSCLLAVLTAPWLQMAWLAALARPIAPSRALGLGWARYLRALSASLAVTGVVLAALVPVALLLRYGHGALSSRLDQRADDLLLGGGAVLSLLCLGFLAMVVDLARAHALDQPALRSAMRALRLSLRPGVWLSYSLYALLASCATCASLALLWTQPQGSIAPWLALSASHGLLLLRALLRSAWLASALERALA